jgi:hypothetical protein
MKCPSCGADDQTGKFCAACGAGLDVQCSSCGAEIPAGARFCTACGEPVAGASTEPSSRAPWIIAVISVVVVVALVAVFLPRGTTTAGPGANSPSAPFMGAGDPQGSTGGAALSADMRTNADRLFNRIMMAAEQGNEAEVAQFMPMAIQAYGMVDDLDNDGIYHLAMLHLTAGSFDQALETSQRILDDEPEHLLGLAVAAEAAAGAGDSARADAYWRRYLDAYPAEASKPLPEYVDHQPMLGEYQGLAQEALGQQ